MCSLKRLMVMAVVCMVCVWSVHAQGGAVGNEPPPPMDPGGLPGTAQPTGQAPHAQGQVYLDARVIHIGDGQDDAPGQGTYVGGVWQASFTTDRPITGVVGLESVGYVNTDGAATVRLGGAGGMLLSGTVLGTVDYEHNVTTWASPQLALQGAGGYTLTVISNDKELLGVDDFVFGPAVLLYQPAEAVVTVTGGPVGGPPTMEYLPQAGIGLSDLPGGQAVQWGGAWHIAHTGYTVTFLRDNGSGGYVGVAIPLGAGDNPVILDTNGTQWVAPGPGGQWYQPAELYLPFSIAASIPANGALGDISSSVGPWTVSFSEDLGVRWMVLDDRLSRILLNDQGQILYEDITLGETYSFAE